MTRLDPDLRPAVDRGERAPLVIHVVRQFLPSRGGLEDVVFNLCREAIRNGYRVRVVTLDRLFSAPGQILPAFANIDGIEVERIPWRGSSRYPVALSVLRHIREADIVHVHAVDFFYDYLALTRFIHRKPLIATTHGGFFHTRKFSGLKALWFLTVTRLTSAAYDHLVACSRSDMETFAKISGKNLRLIENGVDTGKFHDRAAREPVRRIVTIGRFSANKRLDRLIAAMGELVRRDSSWTLDIVGVESDETVASLMAMAQGIEANVRVHVGLSNTEIAGVISACSIFASASEYEGFGLVAIEAMSAGLLPVLEANSAYTALAGSNPNVMLADFADAARAADRLEEAHAALAARGAEIRTGLIAAADAYSWSGVASRYFALYAEIAATLPGVAISSSSAAVENGRSDETLSQVR